MTDAVEASNPRVARFMKRSADKPDLRLPEATLDRHPGSTMKRKRSDTNFEIASDAYSQVDPFRRQKNDDGYDSMNLTPSHRIPDVLASVAREPTPTISTEEPQPSLYSPVESIPTLKVVNHGPDTQAQRPHRNLRSELPANLLDLQSSQAVPRPSGSQPHQAIPSRQFRPNDESKAIRKWGPKEWDETEFDSDEENMSLAVTMRLANELSLLKSFLEIYRKFNIHLGGKYGLITLECPWYSTSFTHTDELLLDIVSGPRHRGFLFLISSTITRLESHAMHLHTLRTEKQRGNPSPSTMELIAEQIARKFKTCSRYLWDVMEEKVDMTNDVARASWNKKKRAVLGDVMGGMVGYLEELGEEEGWKEREVRELGNK